MNIGILVAVVAAAISVVSAYFIRFQASVERQSLALETYDKAVHTILALKADFAAHPGIFADQRTPTGTWQRYDAEGTDAQEFLLFAQGFWRLSYAYSVAQGAHRGQRWHLDRLFLLANSGTRWRHALRDHCHLVTDAGRRAIQASDWAGSSKLPASPLPALSRTDHDHHTLPSRCW
jgi:hypothetical protein